MAEVPDPRMDSSPGSPSFLRPGISHEDRAGRSRSHSPDSKEDRRTYTEGIFDLSSNVFSPLKINISIPLGNVVSANIVGSWSLDTRQQTITQFEFSADDIPPGQPLWDAKGRGVMVDGFLRCKVSHRITIMEERKGGLVLGILGPNGIGGEHTDLSGNFFDEERACSVGPIPAQTTEKQIAELCRHCHNKVIKTLQNDVKARANSLTWLVKNTLCKQDKECYRENGPWSRGRCVLNSDENGAHFTECQARSKIGGPCPGEGAFPGFSYKCEKGLKCMHVYKGSGFWNWSGSYEYDKWECRDPKHPEWTQTPKGYYKDE